MDAVAHADEIASTGDAAILEGGDENHSALLQPDSPHNQCPLFEGCNEDSSGARLTSAAAEPAPSLKGKEAERPAKMDQKQTLRLLDLPVDVLKEIIKEVCSLTNGTDGFGLMIDRSRTPTISRLWR